MDITRIKQIGYFDEIVIRAKINPMYKSEGIILEDVPLKESMNIFNKSDSNAVAQLNIGIYGEVHTRLSNEEHEEQEAERDGLNLKQRICGKGKQWQIGYANILIIKNKNQMLDLIDDGRNIEAFQRLAKTEYEIDILTIGLNIASIVSKQITSKKSFESMSIAIIDKIYIEPPFRGKGINTWLNNNLVDIIKGFGMVNPDIILLQYGDFTEQSESLFGMNTEEYKKMLYEMYKKLGYKKISVLMKCMLKSNCDGILYKIIRNEG